ncbi:ABC transporter permease subunit [Acuticoccus kandeliae]|uniref:ABC transporter permease subunit n=1 Tax=Acuticoccus kandeliae TaxID=2073160 RepID=UPI0013008EBD|nr:ABC transporter permease subunit [Acuticoccus kandeliae]
MTLSAQGARRFLPLLIPAAAFLLAFYLIPLARFMVISVTEPSAGLGNYIAVLGSGLYWAVIVNTFEIAFTVAILCLLLAYPVALLIARLSGGARTAALICVVVPFFTSDLVRNYAWIFLLGNRGVINTILISTGIIDSPLRLIFNRFAVVVAMTHILMPYVVLLLLNGIGALDRRLTPAAASLGAGAFGTFRRVILPMTRESAVGGFVLVFVIGLAFFVTPAMLGGPSETMIANTIASEMGFLRWGFAASLSAVMLVATFATLGLVYALGGGLGAVTPELARSGKGRRRTRIPSFSRTFILIDRVLDPVFDTLVAVIGIALLAFLILPVVAVIPLSLSPKPYFEFPPSGISFQWFEQYVTSPRWYRATLNSLMVGAGVAALALAIGLPAAFAIARSRSRIAGALYVVALSPLVVPSIIIAVSVFVTMTSIGLNRSLLGVGLGQTISALPPALIVLVAALKGFDWTLTRAGQSLGASPFMAVVKIALPIIGAAIGTAALLAFLQSFNDLLVALFVSGLRTETLPKRMWESLEEVNPTIAAVSALLVLATAIVLATLQIVRRGRRKAAPVPDALTPERA